MDSIKAAQNYINRIVTDIGGLKALLMDEETMPIVSLVYSRTTILEKEVFLIDRLSNEKRQKMTHLKCVVFVRPNPDNVRMLEQELRSPKYCEYHIFFSNMISRDSLAKLATADESELVKQVQEYYADFYAHNREVFTLGVPTTTDLSGRDGYWNQNKFDRITQGILSVLLAMKRRPYIRFQSKSQNQIAQKIARSVTETICGEHDLFNFGVKDTTLLLILDRAEDPVTPLLTQWTYQAMIHEFFGINNNRVIIPSKKKNDHSSSSYDPTGDKKKDKEAENEVVLSTEYDHFFNKNLFCNWGDLCLNIKQFVDEFKAQSNSTQNITSVDDLKNFMHKFPEFKKMGGNVSKHVNLVSEIGEEVKQRGLLDLSVIEQEIACNSDKVNHFDNVRLQLTRPEVLPADALRLALLYVVKYEKTCRKDMEPLKAMLKDAGCSDDEIDLLDCILEYGGYKARAWDLFGKEGVVKESFKVLTSLAKGFKDVENVFTQHEPLIRRLLQLVVKAKLPEDTWPYNDKMRPPSKDWRPKEIVLFICGGVTYEEVLFVNAFNDPTNKNNSVNGEGSKTKFEKCDAKVLLGGTSMLNSKQFLNNLHVFTPNSDIM